MFKVNFWVQVQVLLVSIFLPHSLSSFLPHSPSPFPTSSRSPRWTRWIRREIGRRTNISLPRTVLEFYRFPWNCIIFSLFHLYYFHSSFFHYKKEKRNASSLRATVNYSISDWLNPKISLQKILIIFLESSPSIVPFQFHYQNILEYFYTELLKMRTLSKSF